LPSSTLVPYTTLFRSRLGRRCRIGVVEDAEMAGLLPGERLLVELPGALECVGDHGREQIRVLLRVQPCSTVDEPGGAAVRIPHRSEEHTSELQSRFDI